jgi:hypothetical protein
MTLDEARRVCIYRLRAARYHHNTLEALYSANRAALNSWVRDYPAPTPTVLMPFYYHLDSFLYQLASCFEMLLQIVNIKIGVGFPDTRISWNLEASNRKMTPFMKAVKMKDEILFEKIHHHYKDDLFVSLRNARNFIAHRGALGLYISYSEESGMNFARIAGQPIDPGAKSYEPVEQCKAWGDFMGGVIAAIDPGIWPHV